ncbi:MAG: hypothetical protein AAF702_29325 [Chloroflexota bacterium]
MENGPVALKVGLKYISLGAGAGTSKNGEDGLTGFKSGWANGQRTTYLCSRIFNQTAYQVLAIGRDINTSNFFPTYRASVLKSV